YPRGNVIGDLGVVQLDGSGLRKLVSLNSPHEAAPAWSPDGSRLLVTDRTSQYSGPMPLFAVDTAGTRTALPENSAVIGQAGPAYSRDGAWVYYTGMLPQQDFTLWRMRPDGTGHQQLRPRDWAPARTVRLSPSGDGTRAVFEAPFEWRLSVLDLQTLAVVKLGVMGRSPRWSPVAELIAYIADDGSIRGVLPNGTGDRALSPGGRRYWPEVDWSPDGRYLISRSGESFLLEVIDPATRTAIPLPFSREFRSPAWKP
ncbi:hypothetical protein, partial [Longimicrobium sp.]|uniref:TolB family protein n=1 Tax=Longimicrobium sp. TaxID=2029185 RepID=UPI002F957FE5